VLSPEYNDFIDAQQAVNLGIMRRFEQAGIHFAFPTRTVHLVPPESPTRVQVESRRPQGNGASESARYG
jgi:small-conductance mechanosensitive channel